MGNVAKTSMQNHFSLCLDIPAFSVVHLKNVAFHIPKHAGNIIDLTPVNECSERSIFSSHFLHLLWQIIQLPHEVALSECMNLSFLHPSLNCI